MNQPLIPPGVLEGAVLGRPLTPKPDRPYARVQGWNNSEVAPNPKQQDAIGRSRLGALLPRPGDCIPWAEYSADAIARARARTMIDAGSWPEFRCEMRKTATSARPAVCFVRVEARP